MTGSMSTVPPTHRGLAIAAAIIGVVFGGLIGAIPASFALKASGRAKEAIAHGSTGLAQEEARKALTLSIVAIVLSVGIFVVLVASGAFSSSST